MTVEELIARLLEFPANWRVYGDLLPETKEYCIYIVGDDDSVRVIGLD